MSRIGVFVRFRFRRELRLVVGQEIMRPQRRIARAATIHGERASKTSDDHGQVLTADSEMHWQA